jgi:phage gp36-like protein
MTWTDTYVQQADLEVRFTAERVAEVFSVRASDGSTTGVADDASMHVAALDATTEVNEKLAPVYATPFVAPLPASVVEIVAIITMWRGMVRRPEFLTEKNSKPYEMQYRDARTRLQELHDGTSKLDERYRAANSGGAVVNENVETARPFYFTANPDDGSGGMGQF